MFEAPVMTLQQFRRQTGLSMQGICRELFRARQDIIGVQKEKVAVKNLSKILEATLILANQKGFAAMSLRDLSAKSGLSMGGLYTYIGSKEELAAMIQAHGRQISMRPIMDEIESAAPEDRLTVAIRTHLYVSEILRSWFYFSYMESRHLNAREKSAAIESERATESLFRNLIAQGQDAQRYRDDVDALMVAALIKAMLADWYLKRGKYRERGINVEDYADSLLAIINTHLQDDRA